MPTYQELLQLPYQEFLDEVLRDAPKNCTWHEVASWLGKQYSNQQIAEMNAKLYKQLCIFTPDNADEDPAADPLRDEMDIFWRAGDHELNEHAIHTVLKEMDKSML